MHILRHKGLVFAYLIFGPSNHVSAAQNALSLRHTIYQAYSNGIRRSKSAELNTVFVFLAKSL
jgi:hypothetical protein